MWTTSEGGPRSSFLRVCPGRTAVFVVILTYFRSTRFTPNIQETVNNKIRDFLLITVDSVKSCEESEILPYLPANRLACQFHRSQRKTRETWVRQGARSQQSRQCIFPFGACVVPWGQRVGLRDSAHGVTAAEEPQLGKGESSQPLHQTHLPNLSLKGSDHRYYPGQQTNRLLPRRTHKLSVQGFGYRNNLENIVQSEKQHAHLTGLHCHRKTSEVGAQWWPPCWLLID